MEKSFKKKIQTKTLIYLYKLRGWLDSIGSIGTLDYQSGEIKMLIDNLREKETRLKSCEKEPETVLWLDQNADENIVFYDIGANVGAYSLIAAHKGARVFAFEPAFQNFYKLERNILLNGLSENTTSMPVAFSDQTFVGDFKLMETEFGTSRCYFNRQSIFRLQENNNMVTRKLQVFRLDDLISIFKLPIPHMMKIDVDGGELEVVNGAKKTLADNNLLTVLIEIDIKFFDKRDFDVIMETAGLTFEASYYRDDRTLNCLYSRR
jgi:FkbM family methyltransferase